MALTTIALHVEPETLRSVDAAMALPLAIAEAHGAHVTALVFSASAAQGEAAAPDLPENEQASREDAVVLHLQEMLQARGMRFEVRGRSSFAYGIGDVLADQMRVSDLGVMSFATGADLGKRFLANGGLFYSGRPLLLLPAGRETSAVPARIVVAWDASAAAVRAVHGALPLMRQAAVTVVSVTDDKEFRPGQSGVELTRLLARHGADATFRPVQRGRGGVTRAIQDVAREVGAEMMVMGAVRHAPIHNIVFGSATVDLFGQGPTLPTLLAA